MVCFVIFSLFFFFSVTGLIALGGGRIETILSITSALPEM